ADASHAPAARDHRPPTRRPGARTPLPPGATGTHSPRDLPACCASGTTARGRAAPAGRPEETDMLEAVLALLGFVVGAVLAGVGMRSRGGSAEAARAEAERELASARREADAVRKEAEVAAKEHMLAARSEAEDQLKARSLEVARSEERLGARAA